MTSYEKILALIDSVQGMNDPELADAFPLDLIPVPLVRAALVAIEPQIPSDPVELDGWLERIAEFCQTMRSDDEIPAIAAGP